MKNEKIIKEPVDIFSTEAIEDRWEEYKKKAEKDEDDLPTPEEIGLKW